MASKYDPLGKYLSQQPISEVRLTFSDIERIVGTKLPPKAQRHPAWWSNSPSNNVMTQVWLDAGFRSEQVDIVGRKLVFRRVRGTPQHGPAPQVPPGGMGEATHSFKHDTDTLPPRRHPMFGAMKGLIVLEPGYDLTQPALPEWADLLDEKYGPEKAT